MKEKLKYLIPVIIITCLLLPKPAFAFLGTGIFDFFNTALEGVEEISGPVAKFLVVLFFFYVIGLGSLFISSYLLQLVLGNIQWLSVTNNPMVLSGWGFVVGLTNMFFILIFVFIALATILKIETLAAKKLLPKLLLVALLVNFSLIFVGVIIDISNIFYATIIGGDTDLIPDIFSTLTGSGEDILNNIIEQLIVLAIAFIVPIGGPFAQLGLVILIIATGFIGKILIWLIQGMMFFMMSGILLVFVFLFAARIFVLQLLAMVAPIAFLCSVLPQTKKYWDDWLKMVVEWNTFGIVTLLFLIVGLRGANSLLPPAATADITFSGATLFWGDLPGHFTYYFFLFVYLVALLYFSNKYSPQMASMLISQAKSFGGMIYAKGLKPFGRAAKPAVQKAGRWAGKKAGGGLAKFGEKQRLRGKERLKDLEGKKGLGSWLRRRGGKLRTATASRLSIAGSRMVVGAGESETRAIEEAKKKTKGKVKSRQFFELKNAFARKDYHGALGAAESVLEDENLEEAKKLGIIDTGNYRKLVEMGKRTNRKTIYKWDPDEAMKIVESEKYEEAKKKEKILIKEGGEKLTEGKELKERAEVEEVTQPGLAKRMYIRAEELIDKGEKEIEESKNQLKAILSEFIEKFKPSDVKLISPSAIRQKKHLREAIVDTFTGNQMGEIGRNFGRDVVASIQDEIEKRDFRGLAKSNPSLALWLYGNAAQNLGFSLPSLKDKEKRRLFGKYGKRYKKWENFGDTRYTKDLVKEEVAGERKAIREGEERSREKEKFLKPLKGDLLKIFKTYHSKTTFNKQKEFIRESLNEKSDGKATIPPKIMVERMVKYREKAEKKEGQEVVNRAVDMWRKDTYEGKTLEFTKKYIDKAREKIAEEKRKKRRVTEEEISRLQEELKPEPMKPGPPPSLKERRKERKERKRTAVKQGQIDIRRKPKREDAESQFFRNDKLYKRDKSGKEIEIKPSDYTLKALEEVKKARKRKEEEKANLDLKKKLDDIGKGEE